MELNQNLQDELAKLLKIIRWILILVVCLSLLSILVAIFFSFIQPQPRLL